MKNIIIPLILGCFVGTLAGCCAIDVLESKVKAELRTETETVVELETETEEITPQDYTYIICDVTETNEETFVALMPN